MKTEALVAARPLTATAQVNEKENLMRTSRKFVAVAATAAVAISAAAPVAHAQPAVKPSAAKPNIVQTAVAAGKFTTLAALLKQAGLAGTLQGKGPFTVFAPTDAAFAKVPKATLAALGKDRAKLRAVLLYHVAAGRVTAAKIVRLHSVRTLNGQAVKVRVSQGKVTIGGAGVIATDIGASNGVIHVIDKVLIPPR
jgi:uncharacterized surface protein with fasciclin (FAS1) repeats